ESGTGAERPAVERVHRSGVADARGQPDEPVADEAHADGRDHERERRGAAEQPGGLDARYRHRERRGEDADREGPGLDAAELTPQAMHPPTLSDRTAEVQACAPVRFSGKRAVVSGAANGIGRAVAERLT